MPDILFHVLDGVQVVLQSRGVFYQRDVYYQDTRLFAKHGGGFVRLGEGGGTSAPAVSWIGLDIPDHMSSRVVFAKFKPPVLSTAM